MCDAIWVVGMGVVTPIGLSVESFWESLLTGRSGAGPVTSFDTAGLRTHHGCEATDFDAAAVLGKAGAGLGRATAMTVAAAAGALASAGLLQLAAGGGAERLSGPAAVTAALAAGQAVLAPEVDRTRAGISLGTTMGEAAYIEASGLLGGADSVAVEPRAWAEVVRFPASSMAAGCASLFDLEGPQLTIPTACAAGNYAIADALELLRAGEADLMLAGGADAFSRSAFIGFSRLHAMAPEVCRPFDAERRGLLLGEGAAILVLEGAVRARTRGAHPLAVVLGADQSCDAHHITSPHPAGLGAIHVMCGAIANAGLGPGDIDYVNAHGTGTPLNDRTEALAVRRVFGARTERLPVSSIKALTGHTMGAAGAIEAVASVLALVHQVVPPTWNYRTPDPEIQLDVVPNAPRAAALRTVLNNSYAFGGNNCSVVLGKADSR